MLLFFVTFWDKEKKEILLSPDVDIVLLLNYTITYDFLDTDGRYIFLVNYNHIHQNAKELKRTDTNETGDKRNECV